jgi:hypothetical protein
MSSRFSLQETLKVLAQYSQVEVGALPPEAKDIHEASFGMKA